MSRLDALMEELTSNGVRYKPLGDLCSVFSGFAFKSQFFNTDSVGIPIIRIRDVNSGFTNTFFSGEYDDEFLVENGDILIGMDGDFRVARWQHGTALLNQRVCRLQDFTEEVLPDFIYYTIQDELDRIHGSITGSTVKHLSARELRQSNIPIPPLEVQCEIVKILDTFTALEAGLEAGLEAELEARQQQYEYYQQLVFDQLVANGAKNVPLAEVGQWYGGGTPSKANKDFWTNGSIPWISPKDMGVTTLTETEDHITESAIANSSTKLVPARAVAMVTRSSILDRTLPVAFVPIESTLNQDLKAVIAAEGILPRYLFHTLRASRASILRTVRRIGGSVASLDSKKLWKFEVPIPDLNEQERVVTFFDKFDALVNDFSAGLSAEIRARRQQYKYYRDRLLTFEELEGSV